MKPSLLRSIFCLLVAVPSFIGCKSTPPPPRPAVTGTLNYDALTVTPGCTIEVRLDDVSRADAPAHSIAREFVSPRETAPLPFELHYEPTAILPNHRYVVFAKISCGGELLFTTDTAVPVITQGNPSVVNIILKPVAR